jgi:hypothetical protein
MKGSPSREVSEAKTPLGEIDEETAKQQRHSRWKTLTSITKHKKLPHQD